jgi:hypothetical protein
MTPEEHEEWIERGRLLFAGPIDFERGVPSMEFLPDAGVPETAFAGRSNVGKSSLINALTGRNKLARASTEPGRTRELNFFRVGDVLRLVDLPGYGYAKAPKNESGVPAAGAVCGSGLRERSVGAVCGSGLWERSVGAVSVPRFILHPIAAGTPLPRTSGDRHHLSPRCFPSNKITPARLCIRI